MPSCYFSGDEDFSKKRPRPLCATEADMDPYRMLRVRRDATPSEIRDAYKRLALWHHPGRRKDVGDLELLRRMQTFSILAACYETLEDNDSRSLYDMILIHQTGGNELVGGSPWVPSQSPSNLNKVFSGCDNLDGVLDDALIPSLIPSVSSYSDDRDRDNDDYFASSELSYSVHSQDSDHYKIARDPLQIYRRARRGRPFSDPYDVFDTVFGTHIFRRIRFDNPLQLAFVQRPLRSSAWTGTTERRKDGTKVSTTSRILNGRLLVRTETITCAPNGRRRKVVAVEGDDLVDELEPLVVDNGGCFSCHGGEQSWTDWGTAPIQQFCADMVKCGEMLAILTPRHEKEGAHFTF